VMTWLASRRRSTRCWSPWRGRSDRLAHRERHRQGIIAVMSFQPVTVDRPCWHCRWYEGLDGSGTVTYCARVARRRCCTQPARGSSAFERAMGRTMNLSGYHARCCSALPLGTTLARVVCTVDVPKYDAGLHRPAHPPTSRGFYVQCACSYPVC
jgi:hypothetical protein